MKFTYFKDAGWPTENGHYWFQRRSEKQDKTFDPYVVHLFRGEYVDVRGSKTEYANDGATLYRWVKIELPDLETRIKGLAEECYVIAENSYRERMNGEDAERNSYIETTNRTLQYKLERLIEE